MTALQAGQSQQYTQESVGIVSTALPPHFGHRMVVWVAGSLIPPNPLGLRGAQP